MCVCLHVKPSYFCLILSKPTFFQKDFGKNSTKQSVKMVCLVGAKLSHADGQI
jgi:hypothetical protein